jgi:hypothetical protein
VGADRNEDRISNRNDGGMEQFPIFQHLLVLDHMT